MGVKKMFMLMLSTFFLLSACSEADNASSDTDGKSSARINNAAAHTKYAEVLEEVIDDGVLPDGTKVNTDLGAATENVYAVTDIDGDLKDELIILYNTTYISEMKGYVLAYDSLTDSVYTELENFPSFVFYNRGLMKVEWSHNQGYGEMHPYTLFNYDKEADTYYPIAVVDSWNRAIRAEGYPTAFDADHSGTIYYVYQISDARASGADEDETDTQTRAVKKRADKPTSEATEENGNARSRYYIETLQGYDGVKSGDIDLYSSENIVTKSDYEKWYRMVGQNTGKLTVNYKKITEENISALK